MPLLPGWGHLLSGSRDRPEEAKIDTYEVMLIVIPELDEEQVESTIGRFRTIIERTGGEVSEMNNWGRRKLAYEIDHRADGFYYVMEFTAGKRTLNELKRILRVSDDVLRHMIVKLPPTYAHKPLPEPAEVSG
ncbi:MAG: 30S ribosomal protein S6 [Actinomycetota bacterium]|nr:30S ribosomal protein S6 [Actinomycetota bacterium]